MFRLCLLDALGFTWHARGVGTRRAGLVGRSYIRGSFITFHADRPWRSSTLGRWTAGISCFASAKWPDPTADTCNYSALHARTGIPSSDASILVRGQLPRCPPAVSLMPVPSATGRTPWCTPRLPNEAIFPWAQARHDVPSFLGGRCSRALRCFANLLIHPPPRSRIAVCSVLIIIRFPRTRLSWLAGTLASMPVPPPPPDA